MEASISLVSEIMKNYLVACFNEADCINHFQKVYLKIKKDNPESDARISKERMEISNGKFSIIFRTRKQIQLLSIHNLFNGMIETPMFQEYTWIESKQEYKQLLQATKAMYGINDRDGFLKYLMRR